MYTVVTHDGKFHCDDIFGIAVLQLRFGIENLSLTRTRELSLIEAADIVLDVGGVYDPAHLRFDHHQNGAPVRENGIAYAAFGLLWKEYGEEIAGSKEIAEKIDKKLAQPVDAGDNGIPLYEINQYGIAPAELYDILESYMPPIGSKENPDEAFLKAVEIAREYLVRIIERARAKEILKAKAREVYEAAEDKTVLVFDSPMKRDIFTEYPEVQAIVTQDDQKTKWTAVTIPADEGLFTSRVYFPEAWGGLRDEELKKVSGIDDAIFCHKARFIFVASSREGAMRAAREAK